VTLGVYPIWPPQHASCMPSVTTAVGQHFTSFPHHHFIPCTMPPKSKKQRPFWSRFASLFGSRGGRSAVDSRRDSAKIPNAPSSVPDLLLHAGSSTLQSQPPIRPSRSENSIVESSQCTALLIPGTQDLRPQPVLQSDNNPPAYRAHGAPESHGPQPPVRQSRRENNITKSSQYGVALSLSMTSNQDLLRPPHQPLPALQPADDPALPRVHGGTTSFLTGASGFRMRDIHYYEASQPVNTGGGAGDTSIDGMSKFIQIH
jgi:hypothetical protein